MAGNKNKLMVERCAVIFDSSVLQPLDKKEEEALDYSFTSTGKLVPPIDRKNAKDNRNGMSFGSNGGTLSEYFF